MAFTSGTLALPPAHETGSGYRRLFRLFRRFATGCVTLGTTTRTATGNGTIGSIDSVDPSGGTETWTITFTSATNFTVTGSVSGAQAAGTVGTNYTSNSPAGRISFLITAGGTPFAAADQFTIPVTANSTVTGNDEWIVDRFDPFSSDLELIWHGVGLAGTDLIYTGFRIGEVPASQQYWWELRGFTGYSSSDIFTSQPGTSLSYFTPFWDQAMRYWISVTGRRVIVAAQVSTTYHCLYSGLFLPYSTPAEYPYPLFVSGEFNAQKAYNDTDLNGFFDPGQGTVTPSGAFRRVDGTWLQTRHNITPFAGFWPHNQLTQGRDWLLNLEDNGDVYPLFPMNLMEHNSSSVRIDHDVLGYLDGAVAIPGFGLASEDTITVGGDTYTVLQNVQRTGRADFWALKNA
ncbi:MAG: hypothetical protein HC923_01185 [Myxococcales bacterium]|nr:hypothetical protein [Myxococcales bacterium]